MLSNYTSNLGKCYIFGNGESYTNNQKVYGENLSPPYIVKKKESYNLNLTLQTFWWDFRFCSKYRKNQYYCVFYGLEGAKSIRF